MNEVNFKPGDLIFAHDKGIHRCVRIEQRFASKQDVERFPRIHKFVGEEYSPLVYYTPVCDSNFKPRKSKETCCDASYCRKVDLAKLQVEKQAEFDQYMANLEKIVATYG